MKKTRALHDFLQMGDARLETFTGFVISCMTNNAYFAQPMPALSEVITAHQQYVAALNAAQSRDRRLVEEKRQVRKKLEAIMSQFADYVTLIAAGNRAIIVSAGFTASAAPRTTGKPLGNITNFDVTLGKNSGEVVVSVNTVDSARYYIFYWAVSAETIVWNHESDTIPSYTFSGLEPLKTYLFRVIAKGTKGQSAETTVITKAVV